MACLGLEPGAAGWKVETNPLSYGSPHVHFNVGLVNNDLCPPRVGGIMTFLTRE